MQNIMERLQKTKIKITSWSSSFTLRYTYLKKVNINSNLYMYSNICTTLFTITKIWKQSKCPAAYELIKINYTHTMEYHSPTEKSENLPFVKHGWIRRIFMLSEINQKNSNTHCCVIIYFWTPENKTVKSLLI